MRIAIPLAGGQLALHFGHSDGFALVEVEDGQPANTEQVPPPAHAPGVLPRWLAEQGCSLIIAGGIGRRAQDLFAASGIDVISGAPQLSPEELVRQYLAGNLETGGNLCDH